MKYLYKIRTGKRHRLEYWEFCYRHPFWFWSQGSGKRDGNWYNHSRDAIHKAIEHHQEHMKHSKARRQKYIGTIPESPGDVVKILGDELNR
jgi:hypothetical protein